MSRGRPLLVTAARTLCALALGLGSLGSLGAAGATAATSGSIKPAITPLTPVTRGSTYLALGDSVTFGYQESTVVPAPNYADASSFLGYPEQIAAALHVTAINPACPGETSSSLINASAPSNGCEDAYRKAFPLHVHYAGSQLAYAVAFLRAHPGVRLVSLMIGANDLFLCENTTADHCASEQQAVLAKLALNVKRILSAVRSQAHYGGQLAMLNYYSLNYTSPVVNEDSLELNHTVDTAAKPFHVVIADGYGEFQTASVRFGNQPCLAGLLTQLGGTVGDCGVHPSYAGQALLAQAVEKAIRF